MPRYNAGDFVKVEFKDPDDPIGEWMWVRVEGCDEERRLIFGVLDNDPINEYGEKLRRGSQLAVSYDKVREHRRCSEFSQQ